MLALLVMLTLAPPKVEACSSWSFVALGDGRSAVPGVGPSAYWQAILGEAAAVKPRLIVNTGDLVYDPANPAEWARFRETLKVLEGGPPFLAVRGNHDRGADLVGMGLSPGGLFAWRMGSVLLVGLDTEGPDGPIFERIARLDALLAQPAPWKIVVMHRPVWSRGNHGSDERGLNARLVPLFDRHRVALVLSGHDHDYERFCPSVGLGAQRRCTPEGTTYVVTGGAGTFTNPVPGLSRKVSPATAAADALASRRFSSARHFVEVQVRPARLRLRIHRTLAGNLRPPGLIEEVELAREDGCPR